MNIDLHQIDNHWKLNVSQCEHEGYEEYLFLMIIKFVLYSVYMMANGHIIVWT